MSSLSYYGKFIVLQTFRVQAASFVISNLQKFAKPIGDSYVPVPGGTIQNVLRGDSFVHQNHLSKESLLKTPFRIILILMNSGEGKFVILRPQRQIARNIRTSYYPRRPVEIIN
jgi:hypothetical protein